MIPVSRRDGGETASTTEDRAESRLAALARDLVDKVGIDGAMRYCHSLGWRGVLDQVENLRSQRS